MNHDGQSIGLTSRKDNKIGAKNSLWNCSQNKSIILEREREIQKQKDIDRETESWTERGSGTETETSRQCQKIEKPEDMQYDGSKDDLDWRIDFKYFNSIYIMKYLRFRLIKSCSIE